MSEQSNPFAHITETTTPVTYRYLVRMNAMIRQHNERPDTTVDDTLELVMGIQSEQATAMGRMEAELMRIRKRVKNLEF